MTDMLRRGEAFCTRLKLRHTQNKGGMQYLSKALVPVAPPTEPAQRALHQAPACVPHAKVVSKQKRDLRTQNCRQHPHQETWNRVSLVVIMKSLPHLPFVFSLIKKQGWGGECWWWIRLILSTTHICYEFYGFCDFCFSDIQDTQ